MGEIWEEYQSDEKGTETTRAFEVFTQYLYSPKPRTIKKFHRWLRKESGKKGKKATSKGTIKGWSVRWHWSERAAAFDLKNVERIHKQNKEVVDDAFAKQVQTILDQITELDEERKSIKSGVLDQDKITLALKRNSENKAILMKELRLITGIATDNIKSEVKHEDGFRRLADAFK